MDCQWVREHLDDYELDCLPEPERACLAAHLRDCPACRERLEAFRAADAAIRSALAWAQPTPGFARRVGARARRRPRVRRWVLAAAAVAAVVVALRLVPTMVRSPREIPEEPATAEAEGRNVLAGHVCDTFGRPVRAVTAGRSYWARADSAVQFDGHALVVLRKGTEFAPSPSRSLALSMHSGAVLAQVTNRRKAVAMELAPALGGAVARTKGCQFYCTGMSPQRLTNGSGIGAPDEHIRVHVFRGSLELHLGRRKLVLQSGESAIISGGASAGTTRYLEARVRELWGTLGDALLERRRVRALRDHYAQRLLALEAAVSDRPSEALAARIVRLSEAARTHAEELGRLENESPAFRELDAAEATLLRHDLLREEAGSALDETLVLLAAG